MPLRRSWQIALTPMALCSLQQQCSELWCSRVVDHGLGVIPWTEGMIVTSGVNPQRGWRKLRKQAGIWQVSPEAICIPRIAPPPLAFPTLSQPGTP